ncbi:unnamed protein product [Amoebophrya sp. A25]|nr:unnamed protein product [Amoebophrya sp. A25]|eukprot:GSA25T00012263001.1
MPLSKPEISPSTGEPILKRCQSEPRNTFGSYHRMWQLRLNPESLNVYPSQYAATDIKMNQQGGYSYQSYETMRFHRVKHTRCPFHSSDQYSKPYATSQEYGWHYRNMHPPQESSNYYPITSSAMTKLVDNLSQVGIKLGKK